MKPTAQTATPQSPETLEQRLRRDLDAWIAARELIERARRKD